MDFRTYFKHTAGTESRQGRVALLEKGLWFECGQKCDLPVRLTTLWVAVITAVRLPLELGLLHLRPNRARLFRGRPKEAFDAEGIETAFPQRTAWMYQDRPFRLGGGSGKGDRRNGREDCLPE